MKRKNGFTLLELVFVIVVLGIITKFAVEFLAQAYRGFIYQNVGNKLQNQSEMAVELIASKLQYRLKDSVIIRKNADQTQFKALEGADENSSEGYDILEWTGYDIEGFRGDGSTKPYWSGMIDKETAHAIPTPTDIDTPDTNSTAVNNLISILSNGNSGINDAAIFIMGSDSDVREDYGWQFECADASCSTTTGGSIQDQVHAMHPINADNADVTKFVSPFADGVDPEKDFRVVNQTLDDARYKLSWSAYAIVYNGNEANDYDGNLTLYYDYQPWNGEKYNDGKSTVIMQHVSAFRKRQSFNVIKIQVCVKSDLIKKSDQDQEQYSICKEKTIY